MYINERKPKKKTKSFALGSIYSSERFVAEKNLQINRHKNKQARNKALRNTREASADPFKFIELANFEMRS